MRPLPALQYQQTQSLQASPFRVIKLTEKPDSLIRHRYNTHVRVNCTERIVCRLRACLCQELNNVLLPTFGSPTIPSFISCYTYPEILYFQGFLPFSIFLLHNLLHNFQGAFDSLNLFDLLVLGHMDVQVHRNTYIGMT